MKAEERKHLKENELAERLRRGWQTVASGSTTNNIIWGVILVGLALAIGWRYYSKATFQSRSAQWAAIEQAYNPDDLERIIKEHPGTIAARTATFHLNRFRMSEALGGIAGPTSDERIKSADTLAEVRSRYSELARDTKSEPELVQESLMGAAKAEEVLAAIPKTDDPTRPRGSLDDALKSYQDLASKYPESFLGKQAAKRVQELRDHESQVRAFYNGLMEVHGKPSAPPSPSAPIIPSATGPALPEAPKAPSAPTPPTVVPGPPPASSTPAPKAEPPIPPTAPPAGISPAEGPKPPKDEPKPKAP